MSPLLAAIGRVNVRVSGGGADLEDPATLSDWVYRLLLDGRLLLGARRIVTSPVMAIDLGRLGWARTISRRHRLGPPLASDARS